MFIKLNSDQVDDLIVKELTETYANYDEGWFDDSEEMQESIAHVLTHFMTPTAHDEWAKSVGIKRDLVAEVVEGFDHLQQKIKVDERIGYWLSAALEDPSVCQSMKDDINAWFRCTPQEQNT